MRNFLRLASLVLAISVTACSVNSGGTSTDPAVAPSPTGVVLNGAAPAIPSASPSPSPSASPSPSPSPTPATTSDNNNSSASQPVTNPSLLASGQQLTVGQSLVSPSGAFLAILQGDGNFVVYGPNGASFSTLTGVMDQNKKPTQFNPNAIGNTLIMQGDGNLVLYQGNSARWASGTANYPESSLLLQDDGNLVVYQALAGNVAFATWSIATGNRVGRAVGVSPCGVLLPGQQLLTGNSVYSCDASTVVTLQTDGNLVVYGPNGALWSSVTGKIVNGKGTKPNKNAVGNQAVMQPDGNFVLYENGVATWASNTFNYVGAIAAIQGDGNFVVYSNGSPIWSSLTGNLIGR